MNEQINTKDRLIRAGVKLFAKYGYAATSTRMIASEAGVNLSAIAFHYTSKEKLYQACLEYMQEKIKAYYSPSCREIEEALAEGEMSEEKAWHYLERLIDLQIEVAFGKKYQSTLALVYREESGPEGLRPLTREVFDQQERVMAQLLQAIVPLTDNQARVISRFINGSIIAFGEHKSLIAPYIGDAPEEKPGWLRSQIRSSCLAMVRGIKEERKTI